MTREPLEVRYNTRRVATLFDHGLEVYSLGYDEAVVDEPRAALSVRLPPRREIYSGSGLRTQWIGAVAKP